ncbi:MAG: T9SS type A sorting domain-containing protein [Flavobacteriales bacterium]|nr:T9SS type A sorting domain-containing protein [Flavobacteriales bacterium]
MKKFLYSVLFAASALSSQAQFDVDSISDQTSAVEDLFLANGIFVNNISFIGDSAQLGWLTDGDSVSLGINEGLVLSTGVAATVSNGNNIPVGNWSNTLSNPDLSGLTGFPTYDLAQLDFDFIATGDSMTFQFVFGSAEYPEWVGSNFNDIFGFFVNGPGIAGPYTNGAVNLALVPGTNTVVSINTINADTNATLYNDNSTLLIPNFFCDGYTVPMFASIGNLIVGQTYHITLAITDASDAALDSWVFLGGNSFQQFCTVNFLEEEEDRGAQECLLSQVKADLDYTVFCGTITLENQSQVNLNVSNAYYEMGDGNSIPANATDVYSYVTPGNYTVKLVQETIDGFTAKYTLGTFPISEIMPSEPFISQNGSIVSIDNYDPSWLVSWFVSVDGGFTYTELEGITTPSFDVTGIVSDGTFIYAGISNGCLNSSVAQMVVGMDELYQNSFSVYPQPADQEIFFSNVNEPKTVKAFDSTGKLVLMENNVTSVLNISTLSPGFYVLHVTNRNGKQERVSVMVK